LRLERLLALQRRQPCPQLLWERVQWVLRHALLHVLEPGDQLRGGLVLDLRGEEGEEEEKEKEEGGVLRGEDESGREG
jgi:hypothetical protein